MDAAIRATIAMPGSFTPVMIGGRLLADGGIMNPVPVAAIRSPGTARHLRCLHRSRPWTS